MTSYCQLSITDHVPRLYVYKVMALLNMRNFQFCVWFNKKICYEYINFVLHPAITVPLQENNKGRWRIVSAAIFLAQLFSGSKKSNLFIVRGQPTSTTDQVNWDFGCEKNIPAVFIHSGLASHYPLLTKINSIQILRENSLRFWSEKSIWMDLNQQAHMYIIPKHKTILNSRDSEQFHAISIESWKISYKLDEVIPYNQPRRLNRLLKLVKRMITLSSCFEAIFINSVILSHKLSKLRIVKLWR